MQQLSNWIMTKNVFFSRVNVEQFHDFHDWPWSHCLQVYTVAAHQVMLQTIDFISVLWQWQGEYRVLSFLLKAMPINPGNMGILNLSPHWNSPIPPLEINPFQVEDGMQWSAFYSQWPLVTPTCDLCWCTFSKDVGQTGLTHYTGDIVSFKNIATVVCSPVAKEDALPVILKNVNGAFNVVLQTVWIDPGSHFTSSISVCSWWIVLRQCVGAGCYPLASCCVHLVVTMG